MIINDEFKWCKIIIYTAETNPGSARYIYFSSTRTVKGRGLRLWEPSQVLIYCCRKKKLHTQNKMRPKRASDQKKEEEKRRDRKRCTGRGGQCLISGRLVPEIRPEGEALCLALFEASCHHHYGCCFFPGHSGTEQPFGETRSEAEDGTSGQE